MNLKPQDQGFLLPFPISARTIPPSSIEAMRVTASRIILGLTKWKGTCRALSLEKAGVKCMTCSKSKQKQGEGVNTKL